MAGYRRLHTLPVESTSRIYSISSYNPTLISPNDTDHNQFTLTTATSLGTITSYSIADKHISTAMENALALDVKVLRSVDHAHGENKAVVAVGELGGGRLVSLGVDDVVKFWQEDESDEHNLVSESTVNLSRSVTLDVNNDLQSVAVGSQVKGGEGAYSIALLSTTAASVAAVQSTLPLPSYPISISYFSPASLAVGLGDGAIQVFDTVAGVEKSVQQISPGTAQIRSIKHTPGCPTTIISGDSEGFLKVYDLRCRASAALTNFFRAHPGSWVEGLDVNEDGRRVASVGGGGGCKIWDLGGGGGGGSEGVHCFSEAGGGGLGVATFCGLGGSRLCVGGGGGGDGVGVFSSKL